MVKAKADILLHRNVWLSSWVLTISLLGDALLYVILPVHAATFGLSIAAVGFLLAVNRIIRTFTYGLIVQLGQQIGAQESGSSYCPYRRYFYAGIWVV